MLADTGMSGRIMQMVSDHPWQGCRWQIAEGVYITWMSSAIASMLITAVVLVAVIVPAARRHSRTPTGSANLLELLVVFVRDTIARPAIGEKAHDYLPFLLTIFVFILGLNVMGIVPLEAISHITGLPPIGHTATSVPTVCAALACLVLLKIISSGLADQAARCKADRHWPTWACCVASPVLWFASLSPRIPGVTGKLLLLPLALLELGGAVAKCFSLMVRLCANMLSGHTLIAVLMVFVFQAVRAYLETKATQLFLVGPAAVAGAVAVSLLELLVAGLQAYIFTFLTAMFLGLYCGSHEPVEPKSSTKPVQIQPAPLR